MNKTKVLNKLKYGLLAFLLFAANFYFLPQTTYAGTLTNTYIELNRMTAGTNTTFRLVFKTATATATTASIDFNGADATTWIASSGLVSATQAVTSGTCAASTGATALPGTLAASGTGAVISITGITSLAASTPYCVDFTTAAAVHTAAAGEYHPIITVGSDSETVALRTISNDSIVVTATVPPTFNLALSGNSDTFATSLSAAAPVATAGKTVTINTNAETGWFVWAFDLNTGLNSASTAHTIASITPGTGATLSNGVEGYVIGITSITQGTGAGTTSAVAAYSSNGTTTGSGLDTTVRQIASSTGTANGAVFTVKELASISAVTQPGTDYTDTITILGAGYF